MRSKFLEAFMQGRLPERQTETVRLGEELPVDAEWWRNNNATVISVLKYLEDWDTCNARGNRTECNFCGTTLNSSEYSKDNFHYPASYLHFIWNHNVVPDARVVLAAKEWGY